MASTKSRVAIVVCSTRQSRRGLPISTFVQQQIERCNGFGDLEITTLDLLNWKLPQYEDPVEPARLTSSDDYADPRTREWSRAVAAQHAFVFVCPQYNWGYPASLKNAIDQLFHEWNRKPAMIVSYGGRGGGECADQLRQVLMGLRMHVVDTAPALKLDMLGDIVAATKEEGTTLDKDATLPPSVVEAQASVCQGVAELKALLGKSEASSEAKHAKAAS